METLQIIYTIHFASLIIWFLIMRIIFVYYSNQNEKDELNNSFKDIEELIGWNGILLVAIFLSLIPFLLQIIVHPSIKRKK